MLRPPPLPGLARLLLAGLALAALILLRPALAAADGHWVTTWACGPQLTEPGNLPPVPLAHQVLRQFVRTSLGGEVVRVRFSNAYGTTPVVIDAARLALAAGQGSAGAGDIAPATEVALAFQGVPGTAIPAGGVVYSDPVMFPLPPLADVAVSIRFGEISETVVSGHPGSRTTSFIAGADTLSAPALPDASRTAHWYVITGIEVVAPAARHAIAILGDSITDGNGTTTDGNDRWPDFLAKRLQAHAPTAGTGIANMGIGGNGIFGGLGPSAQNRFTRDVLQQAGVRWLILFIGVNDIGGSSDGNASTVATNMINAYTGFAQQARARGITVYGATITPFGGSGYHSTAREAARQTVNTWIRTTAVDDGIFDAVIDFDATVRDPAAPVNLRAAYDKGDHLHLNPVGYEAMAAAIDLGLFAP